MNQVAKEIRKITERSTRRVLLEQYVSIKQSVMRDQLKLDRLLAEQEGVKEKTKIIAFNLFIRSAFIRMNLPKNTKVSVPAVQSLS